MNALVNQPQTPDQRSKVTGQPCSFAFFSLTEGAHLRFSLGTIRESNFKAVLDNITFLSTLKDKFHNATGNMWLVGDCKPKVGAKNDPNYQSFLKNMSHTHNRKYCSFHRVFVLGSGDLTLELHMMTSAIIITLINQT